MPFNLIPNPAALDDATRLKLIELPRIINDWLAPHGGLAGRRILDFGCGFGEMAAGLALAFDPAVVIGIDIARSPLKGQEKLKSWLGADALPSNLRLEQVEPGQLGSLDQVDVIVSWSAIEHVSRASLEQILRDLHQKLAPDGLALIQISPLYFSPFGAHLWVCDYAPWEHLTKSASEVVADIAACTGLNENQRKAVTEMYLELNRLTAEELVELLENAGFQILRRHIERCELRPPGALTTAYTEEALMTEQIVVLLQKTFD